MNMTDCFFSQCASLDLKHNARSETATEWCFMQLFVLLPLNYRKNNMSVSFSTMINNGWPLTFHSFFCELQLPIFAPILPGFYSSNSFVLVNFLSSIDVFFYIAQPKKSGENDLLFFSR